MKTDRRIDIGTVFYTKEKDLILKDEYWTKSIVIGKKLEFFPNKNFPFEWETVDDLLNNSQERFQILRDPDVRDMYSIYWISKDRLLEIFEEDQKYMPEYRKYKFEIK